MFSQVAKKILLGFLILALLPIGCLAAQVLWAVLHHRYDSPNAGYYHSAVHARFSGLDDAVYYFAFDGKTQPEWRWTYFTNFIYPTLQFEWHRFDESANMSEDKGILTLPSLAYQSKHSTGVLTRAVLSKWLLGKTDLRAGDSQSIEAIFGFIEAAGQGNLPAPNHHGYHFQTPVHGSLHHFRLGSGIGGLVFIWVGIWLVLVFLSGRKIMMSQNPQESPLLPAGRLADNHSKS